jgi:hypothetical protein
VIGYRNIVVAAGPLAERSAALERATMLALRDGARLTLVSATGSPPALVWLSPGLSENPLHALQRACEQRLRSLARSMPAEVSVTAAWPTRVHRLLSLCDSEGVP